MNKIEEFLKASTFAVAGASQDRLAKDTFKFWEKVQSVNSMRANSSRSRYRKLEKEQQPVGAFERLPNFPAQRIFG